MSQSRRWRSIPAERRRSPSGRNATLVTSAWWPSKHRTSRPVSRSQTRTVPSIDAEAARRPSGLIATDQMPPRWPENGRWTSLPVSQVPEVQVQVRPGPPSLHPSRSPPPLERVAAVGSDGEREDDAPRALESVKLATRLDVPDPDVRVFPGDDDPLAVGRRRQAVDLGVGADPAPQLAPAGDVPDADRPVVPAGDGALPVGEDGDTGTRATGGRPGGGILQARGRGSSRAVSQSLMAPSQPAVTSRRPSGVNTAAVISSAWPWRVRTRRPERYSQTLSVPPAPDIARCWPSGLQASPRPRTPSKSRSSAGCRDSQIRTVPSRLAEARCTESGWKARATTRWVWPRSTCNNCRLATSQT